MPKMAGVQLESLRTTFATSRDISASHSSRKDLMKRNVHKISPSRRFRSRATRCTHFESSPSTAVALVSHAKLSPSEHSQKDGHQHHKIAKLLAHQVEYAFVGHHCHLASAFETTMSALVRKMLKEVLGILFVSTLAISLHLKLRIYS